MENLKEIYEDLKQEPSTMINSNYRANKRIKQFSQTK